MTTGLFDWAIKRNPNTRSDIPYLTTKVSAEQVCGSLSDTHADVRHLQKKEVLWWTAAAVTMLDYVTILTAVHSCHD